VIYLVAAIREQTPTRERIVVATAGLMMRQGYAATGMKQVAAEAEAPFGSIYHFFPGGKEELGAETIRASGWFFLQLWLSVLEEHTDPTSAVAAFFDGAAETLERTGYADACPIATVALDVASTNDRVRQACAEAFDSWIEALASALLDAGVGEDRAADLAQSILAALEGAFLLSRSKQSTAPMAAARDLSVAAIERALSS
jgi:AcrR family transcriptional regulator